MHQRVAKQQLRPEKDELIFERYWLNQIPSQQRERMYEQSSMAGWFTKDLKLCSILMGIVVFCPGNTNILQMFRSFVNHPTMLIHSFPSFIEKVSGIFSWQYYNTEQQNLIVYSITIKTVFILK